MLKVRFPMLPWINSIRRVHHRSSHDYLRVVTVREEGKGGTVVTTPGRLVYHSRVVDAYHVILDPRERTLIFLNHSLVPTFVIYLNLRLT